MQVVREVYPNIGETCNDNIVFFNFLWGSRAETEEACTTKGPHKRLESVIFTGAPEEIFHGHTHTHILVLN